MLKRITLGVVQNFCSGPKITLPELKYAYSALEPVLSSKLLETHHKKHHQTYVNNLNAALQQFEGEFKLIQKLQLTSITIKWLLSLKLLNLIQVVISIIPSIGKIWHLSDKEEVNTPIKIPPLLSKLSANSDPMKILLKSLPRKLSLFRAPDGDGLGGTIFLNLSEFSNSPTKK